VGNFNEDFTVVVEIAKRIKKELKTGRVGVQIRYGARGKYPVAVLEAFTGIGDPDAPTQCIETWQVDGNWYTEVLFYGPDGEYIQYDGARGSIGWHTGPTQVAAIAAILVRQSRDWTADWRTNVASNGSLDADTRAQIRARLIARESELNDAAIRLQETREAEQR
jgi:hypothetical protein